MELIRTDKDTGIKVLVEWSDLGEGIDGDWNSDDPEDVSLYRFDISVKRKGDEDWDACDDASYCTQVPVDTPDHILIKGLEMIMDEIFEAVVEGHGIKKACERMSWICPDTIERGVWERKWVL